MRRGRHDPAMPAIDHLDLVVSDLERSLAYYSGLLGPLGYTSTGEIVGERGELVVYVEPPDGRGAVGLRERRSGGSGYDRYALGMHHVAFTAVSRVDVERCAAWARDGGHPIESGPQEYPYVPGYYAVFLHDPDGMKLEVVHRPAERDLAATVARLEARLAELEGGGRR